MFPLQRSAVLGLSGFGLLGAVALVSAAPSQAATSCTYAQLSTCTLTSGDKTISGFSSNGGNAVITIFPGVPPTTGFQANDVISLSNNGTTWTMLWDFTPGNPIRNRQAINATFTINTTAPYKFLNTVSISRTGDATTAAQASFLSGAPTISTSALGGFIGPSSTSFSGLVSSTTVTLRFFSAQSIVNGNLNSVTLSFTQKQVPGPLPMVGAGVAFAYSRRIRRRIKSIA